MLWLISWLFLCLSFVGRWSNGTNGAIQATVFHDMFSFYLNCMFAQVPHSPYNSVGLNKSSWSVWQTHSSFLSFSISADPREVVVPTCAVCMCVVSVCVWLWESERQRSHMASMQDGLNFTSPSYGKVLLLGAIAAASAFVVTILIVVLCVGCQRWDELMCMTMCTHGDTHIYE